MKKFWSIFTVALVALSAVSCSNNFEEQAIINGGEALSFNVNIDNTRTALEQGENGWSTVWVGNETVVVSDGQVSYNFSNTAENKNTFTCVADGVLSLVGKSVEVVYNSVINSAAGAAGMTLAGTAEAFSAESYIELSAGNAFVKLTSTADVTLTASADIFGNGVSRQKSVTVKGENVLVPVYAAADVAFSASFAGKVVKEKTLTFANNKIYNLGTLVGPEVSKVWGIVGSYHGWTAESPAAMYVDGDYVVAYNVPAKAEVKFIEIGKGWDGAIGGSYGADNNNPTVSEANTWHPAGTNNILLPDSGIFDVYYKPSIKKYNIVAAGTTPEEYVAPKVALSLSGTFNGWGDTDLVEQNGIYVTKSLKLDAYASFKVRKDKAWGENYGGGIVYMNPNNYILTYSDGSDISITAAGTYDVYFNYETKHLYVVTAGADYTAVPLQTVEGKEPVQEEPEVTEKVIYLKPSANWKQSNARFAIYIWGGTAGEKWVSMTASDTTGIYQAYLPEGYDYGCNIIFCRMNPATSANNWNNKWNQTSNLKTPTDGKNLYTVKENTWDNGGGTWSVK